MVFSLVLIASILFLLYWIFGGALLASVWYIRHMSIHKARFGCLFTLSALVSAIGASYTGSMLGEKQISACLAQADTFVERISGVIGCGAISFGLMAIAWFFLLGGLGMFTLYVSRSFNQSWMDDDPEGNDANLEYYYKEV
jgi:hypothetical protein